MENNKVDIVNNIVKDIADILGETKNTKIEKKVSALLGMETEDLVDHLLVSITKNVDNGKIKKDDAIKIVDKYITKLMPEKYPSVEALISRVKWLQEMNILDMKMPLTENHKMVLEVFDKINELLGKDFDYYHTGGLMGYIATGKPLERYHGDLDLFINEEELFELKKVIDNNPDFRFISSLETKENNGHEFSLIYKDCPIEIGLFLFERTEKNEMVIKKYYYKDKDTNTTLLLDEKHVTKEYSELAFPRDNYLEHNGIPYRVQSLEAIYLSKVDRRPKDKYDAKVIEDKIDKVKFEKLSNEDSKVERKSEIHVEDSPILDFNTLIKDEGVVF